MGSALNAGLQKYVDKYLLNTFVETGTGRGASIVEALSIPELEDIRSIEIDEVTYNQNAIRFASKSRVRFYLGDSRVVLTRICHELRRSARVVWWLDAHFPGSARATPVAMLPLSAAYADAAPLEEELRLLLAYRDVTKDVFLIDDRCMYEADDYEAGDMPEFRKALDSTPRGGLQFVDELLLDTHQIIRTNNDRGYIAAVPLLKES